jgi:hypothetical protein
MDSFWALAGFELSIGIRIKHRTEARSLEGVPTEPN